MTTNPTPAQTPAYSTWALLTHRTVTWRQASEGWAVLAALSAAAVCATVLARLARFTFGRRS
jgi:hypothetical protein